MKNIRLYEAFAGIGAQNKALTNLSVKYGFKLINLGACEFYIDAIISYISIHYGNLDPETNMSKSKMVEILNNYSFSANSKTLVSSNYFNNMSELKLRSIFPYLYSFIEKKYLINRLGSLNKKGRGGDIF